LLRENPRHPSLHTIGALGTVLVESEATAERSGAGHLIAAAAICDD